MPEPQSERGFAGLPEHLQPSNLPNQHKIPPPAWGAVVALPDSRLEAMVGACSELKPIIERGVGAVRFCAVCGDPILWREFARQPYPPNGDWVHVACQERYWDPPGADQR